MKRSRTWLLIAALAATPCLAQDDGAASERPALDRSGAAVTRDGQFLIDVQGRMERDETSGGWIFRMPSARDPEIDLVYGLLPCIALEEMENQLQTVPDALFELTARILTFEKQAYLMPVRVPRLVGGTIATTDTEPAGNETADEAADSDEPRAGDRATELIQSLEQDTGPLVAPINPDRVGVARVGTEGRLVARRRGRLRRDDSGAWVFVFDSDYTGQADPSLLLLPCKTLERIVNAAPIRSGQPIAISGRTYEYRGRTYLLPNGYMRERHRTALTP